MKNIQKSRGLSLKKGLMMIIALCWIIPVVVIVAYSGYTISHNVQDRIEDTIAASVDTAFAQTVERFCGAIDASRALSYDETIENAYNSFTNTQDEIVLYDTVTHFLLQKYGYDDRFNAVFLFFTSSPNNIYYTTKRTNTKEYYGLSNYRSGIHKKIVEIYPEIGTGIVFYESGDELYMVRNIVDKSFNPYAVLVMECDETIIYESLRSVVWLKEASIELSGITREVLPGSKNELSESDGIWYDSSNSYYTIQTSDNIENHKIVLNIISDSSQLVNEFPNLMKALPYIVIFIVIALGLVLLAYFRFVSHPMDMLIDATGRMEEGERGYIIEHVPHSREFRYLTNRFNSMSAQIKKQFEKIYEEQRELQDARVMALRSQINPHFLNNTLESILWAARMANDIKVCKMIESLSIMLNAAMARGGSARGMMAQEIEYVDAYLHITSERLGNRLTITRNFRENTLNALVPCLILQPIVENAIDHGVALQDKGSIELRSFLEDGYLIIEVENDGHISKMDKKKIDDLLKIDVENKEGSKRNCIGIHNVNRRLKILYGDEGGLTITEIKKNRVLSKIVIPNVDFD